MTVITPPASAKDMENPEDPMAPHVSMDRECLRCRTVFSSTWVGERICHRCKSSSAWRQGSPMGSHTSTGRRK